MQFEQVESGTFSFLAEGEFSKSLLQNTTQLDLNERRIPSYNFDVFW